ncbi:MAG: hypothetical protein HGB15_07140 [Chlorobaculum sp.]|jgi:hypothetical protein|nr:hypothetical protein [Chlorobaculum sp.]
MKVQGLVEKAFQNNRSANISLFCNINDEVLNGKAINTLQQVIHIPSTDRKTLN